MKRKQIYLILLGMLISCSSVSRNTQVLDNRNKAVEYFNSGNSYYNKGLYIQSLEFFRLALAYNGSIYHEQGVIRSYNSVGKVYMAMGEREDAEKTFNHALELARDLGDPSLIAQSLNKLGQLHLQVKEYAESLELLEEARGYAEAGKDQTELASVYHNLGVVYKRLERNEEALPFLDKALKLNKAEKLYEEQAANYYMIASIYSEAGNYEAAMSNALLALEKDKYVENALGIAKDYEALGIISYKNSFPSEGYSYLKKALFVLNSLETIFTSYSFRDDKKKILEYLIIIADELELTSDADYYKTLLKDI